MKYFGDTLARQGKQLHIPICPLRINRFELPDIVRFCNDNKYSINFVPFVMGATDVAMHSMSSLELKEVKEFYLNQNLLELDDNSRKNIIEFNELTLRLDRWIGLAIKREKSSRQTLQPLQLIKETRPLLLSVREGSSMPWPIV